MTSHSGTLLRYFIIYWFRKFAPSVNCSFYEVATGYDIDIAANGIVFLYQCLYWLSAYKKILFPPSQLTNLGCYCDWKI